MVSRDIGLKTHILDIIQVIEYENLNEVMLAIVMGVSYRRRGRESSQELGVLFNLMHTYHKTTKVHLNIIPGLETIYKERALKIFGL